MNLLWVLIVVIQFTPFYLLVSGIDPQSGGDDANPYYRYLRYGSTLVPLFYILANFSKAQKLFMDCWAVFILIFSFLLSVFSPLDRSWSTIQYISFTTTWVTAFGLCLKFSVREVAKIITYALLISMASSIFSVIFIPNYGIVQEGDLKGYGEPGFWRGAFASKNNFGHVIGFAFPAILLFGRRFFNNQGIWILGIIMTLLCLWGAHSSTAFVISTAGIIAYLSIKNYNFIKTKIKTILILTLIIILFYSKLTSLVFNLLGKDATLSGRTKVWELGAMLFLKHPIIGNGYSYSTSPEFVALVEKIYKLPHLHNAYLEMALNCGSLSILSILILIIATFYKSIKKTHSEIVDSETSFFVMILIGWLVSGITEPFALQSYGCVVFLGLTAFFALNKSYTGTRILSPACS